MPRLSDSMEEGTIARWLVAVGDEVAKGQPLVEIDTDKATAVYEAERAGTVLEILVSEGESAALGSPIARIGEPGEDRDEPPREERKAEELKGPPPDRDAGTPDPPSALGGAVTANATRTRRTGNASPVARRLAGELGVDLASVAGTGPNSLVTKTDVEQAAGGAGPARARPAGRPLSRVQQTIARRMVEGAAAPVFSVSVDVDLTEAIESRLGETGDPAPSLNDLVVKATAVALRDFPRVNGSYAESGFELNDEVNVGIAVATDDALLVPVVRAADRKTLAEIAAETKGLAARARDGSISPSELEAGTFTVTNLGMFGVTAFVPILNLPQASILSVGAALRRPVFADDSDRVEARTFATITLVCDHRIVYGAEAARFLARVRELLEEPRSLDG